MENEEYMRPRIRVALSSMGFCEKYQAFEYLVEGVFYIFKNNELTKQNYKELVNRLSQHKNVEPICVTEQLGIIITSNKQLCEKLNLKSMGNYNRLLALANFVQERIDDIFAN